MPLQDLMGYIHNSAILTGLVRSCFQTDNATIELINAKDGHTDSITSIVLKKSNHNNFNVNQGQDLMLIGVAITVIYIIYSHY